MKKCLPSYILTCAHLVYVTFIYVNVLFRYLLLLLWPLISAHPVNLEAELVPVCPFSVQLQLWQVQAVHWRHDNRNWLPAKEEHRLLPVRLRQDGCRVYPTVQQPELLCHPAGSFSQNIYTQTQTLMPTLSCSVVLDVSPEASWSSSCFPPSLSSCSVSVTSCLAWWLRTSRPWMPASSKESQPLERNRRYLTTCRGWCALRFILITSKTQSSQYHHLQAFLRWGYFRVVGFLNSTKCRLLLQHGCCHSAIKAQFSQQWDTVDITCHFASASFPFVRLGCWFVMCKLE